MNRISRRLAVLMTAALAVAGCEAEPAGPGSSTASSAPPATRVADPTDVVVQMFSWNWPSIGRACTETLGPVGYAAVQTSPPQESITGPEWWRIYQPVSYKLESRFGTRDQFVAMVKTCDAAGVKVVADVVLNHMTGQETPGTGTGGSSYTHFEYPGIYTAADFHHCGRNGNDDIVFYTNTEEVQTCELLNLADLDTGSDRVRTIQQAYLNDLLSLGVDGFRVDAAKHMSAADLAKILAGLPPQTLIINEVIRGSDFEPIKPEEYVSIGQVQEFSFARDVSNAFRSGGLNNLTNIPAAGRYVPSSSAVSFVDNHDTERNNNETLNAASGKPYLLANVYLLATDYGHPAVYSGYSYGNRDEGPPLDAQGKVTDSVCSPAPAAPWTCFHANAAVTGMVGFHNTVVGTTMSGLTVEGSAVSFSRGSAGYVAINAGGAAYIGTAKTSLPAGVYCDVIHGTVTGGTCSGPTVAVGADGGFPVSVAAQDALAIHIKAKVS